MATHSRHLRAVDKKILIEFYKVQWDVIHGLDNLDWRVALIFIPLIGAFSAVVGILSQWAPPGIANYTQTIQAFALVVFMFCLYGLWTVAKGQAHSMLKFYTLTEVEKVLNLHQYTDERVMCSRYWRVGVCRRTVLYIVYAILGALSLSIVIVPIDAWSLNPPEQPLIWLAIALTIVVGIIIVGIQHRDYELHLRSRETS